MSVAVGAVEALRRPPAGIADTRRAAPAVTTSDGIGRSLEEVVLFLNSKNCS